MGRRACAGAEEVDRLRLIMRGHLRWLNVQEFRPWGASFLELQAHLVRQSYHQTSWQSSVNWIQVIKDDDCCGYMFRFELSPLKRCTEIRRHVSGSQRQDSRDEARNR